MNHRFTLGDRNDFSFRLLCDIEKTRDPEVFGVTYDPEMQPDALGAESYAFEKLLARVRSYFSGKEFQENILYSLAWSKSKLRHDEESMVPYRIARMAVENFMEGMEKNGLLKGATDVWSKGLRDQGIACYKHSDLMLLIYEIFYELAYETAINLLPRLINT